MTLPEPYYNSDKTSFANVSVLTRWPVILTQVIDDVSRAVGQLGPGFETKIVEGKKIIQEVSDFLHEVEHDREIVPIKVPSARASDAIFSDIDQYNESLAEIKKTSPEHTTWHTASWMYSECYMYRRVAAIFQSTNEWTNYDFFSESKRSAFSSSKDGVAELALRYKQLSQQLAGLETNSKEEHAAILEELFKEFIDISLWGNATDLSLLATMSLDEIKNLQGADVRRANEANILVNDTEKAWNTLYNKRADDEGRVDIVLDNSGFELYTDLAFVLFLLDSKLAKSVVLHPKSVPWFVSDVLPHDVDYILSDLKNPTFFGADVTAEQRNAIEYFVIKLESYYKPKTYDVTDGGLFVHTSPFWTTEFSFNSDLTPEGRGDGDKVWEDLINSTLVVFKGDLNHRKLIGDLEWKRTTPFVSAVGLVGGDKNKKTLAHSGIKLVTLRTIKADVLTGIPEGVEEKLNELWWKKQGEKGDKKIVERGWAYSGKWAVIQYSGGDLGVNKD